jgi:NAD(P)-dependent dehydrogenase (short-subunit alcohol dehydrogenase family)
MPYTPSGDDTTGLRVIVTAGGSGIGLAIASAFVEGGGVVEVCDVDAAALDALARDAGSSGRRPIGTTLADVSDQAAVDSFVDTAVERMGGVDVLVNNAGIAGPGGRTEDLDPDEWRRTMDVNVTGMFLVTRRVIPHLTAQRSGSIVNISSTAGQFGFPYRAPYAASKWAVIGFTKTLAMELGEFGVRANAICPGSVDNERMAHVVALEASATGRPSAAIREGFARQVSLQTFVDVEDIAAMVRFVCSPGGARISGQALTVDGHTESTRT